MLKLKLPTLNAHSLALGFLQAKQAQPAEPLTPSKSLLRETILHIFGQSEQFKQYMPLVDQIANLVSEEEADKALDAVHVASLYIRKQRGEVVTTMPSKAIANTSDNRKRKG